MLTIINIEKTYPASSIYSRAFFIFLLVLLILFIDSANKNTNNNLDNNKDNSNNNSVKISNKRLEKSNNNNSNNSLIFIKFIKKVTIPAIKISLVYLLLYIYIPAEYLNYTIDIILLYNIYIKL